jgi:hypothetical protein
VVCFVTVALTLPVESILVRAVSTTTPQAAKDWAQSLSAGDLQNAAGNIQTLPYLYRREVMRRLSPGARAVVWRTHIFDYINTHKDLDASTQALLYNAASLVTPEALSNPRADLRTQLTLVAERTAVVLGRTEAEYLFYRLGAADNRLASALPLADRLAEFVRSRFVVEASREDCDCSLSFGCDVPGHCDGNWDCTKDDVWPMCGWFWDQECNGLCVAGING